MEGLTVCSVVYNDAQVGLLDLMVRSVLKHTSPAPKFLLCDNGGNNLEPYRSLPNFTIVTGANPSYRGSLAHGSSLNQLLPLVTTPYTAIVETDCVVVDDSWSTLTPPHTLLASSKAPGLYHACLLVGETVSLNGIDFRPGNHTRTNRSYTPQEDVGWRISSCVRPQCIDLLHTVDCKSGRGQLFGAQYQSEELMRGDQVVALHLGRGSNMAGKKVIVGFDHPTVQLERWKERVKQLIE